jgi:hypothetical protein
MTMPRRLLERAYRLWKAYKTNTTEYRLLAASIGLTTAELNLRCWWINHERETQKDNL